MSHKESLSWSKQVNREMLETVEVAGAMKEG